MGAALLVQIVERSVVMIVTWGRLHIVSAGGTCGRRGWWSERPGEELQCNEESSQGLRKQDRSM